MSGLKTIRRRIASVKNTKQITRAMKLVSAAKLRRAQEAAISGRKFVEGLANALSILQADLPAGFSHPLLSRERPVKTKRVILISGERGLCGAYNSNVIKAIQSGEKSAGVELEFIAIGRRSVSACKRFGWKVLEQYESLSEDVSLWPIKSICETLVRDYLEEKYDELVIYYTRFVSAMTQVVEAEVLVPFPLAGTGAALTGAEGSESRITKYSPDPEDIVNVLLPLLLRTKISQAGLESKASENAARMTAMDAATNNADELIGKLRLFYNRARQSSITRELIDIVGGAEAIK